MKLSLLLIICPVFLFGQQAITGRVISAQTKTAISFATVGLIKKNIGTTANEEGFFSLAFTSNQVDTLIFSCVGYETLKLPINFNQYQNLTIELSEKISVLAEVIVSNKARSTTVTLNDFSNCGNNFVGSSGYQTQIAQHFQVQAENALLSQIKICRMSISFLSTEKTIFRIRIYDMDTLTKVPSKDLCNEIIEVKTKNETVHLNLEKYKIYIPKKDFFVAVEWLKIPYNESRSKVKVNGKLEEHVSYRPSIGWTDHVNAKMEAWMLDYRNIWQPMFKMKNKTSISIAATVKY